MSQGNDLTAVQHTVRVSEEVDDPQWDAFLADHGAHHTQTSAWSRVKQVDGWQPLRVVVMHGRTVVAGAQMLHRPGGTIGNLAYLPRGPVTAPGHAQALADVLQALQDVTRSADINAVLIEPAPETDELDHAALSRLAPGAPRLSLGATVLLDVARPLEDILAGMRSKTRYNIRRAEKREITVRRARAEHLPTFHRLLELTAQRQGFRAGALSRYRHWFDVLGGKGHLELFLAEHRGEAVSGMLAVAFGDTVVYKRGAWSGRHGELRPNEALHWAAIRWAHHAGYRWYDLDGIDRTAAEAAVEGRAVPEQHLQSVTRFKLGFGGKVMLLPDSLVLFRHAVLGRLYTRIGGRIGNAKRVRRAIGGWQ
jgi:peptidoglycan pentaglycine glycine transferase (the first glycine)